MKLSKLRHATSTRMIRGEAVPRQNTTSFGLRAALKKGGTRYAGEEAGDIEGKAALRRLDRPGRKHGGRVCKEEGGEVKDKSPSNPGEVSDKESSKYLRAKASDKRWEGTKSLAQGAINTVLGATPPKFREIGKFGKTLKAGALVTGPAMLGVGAGELAAASKADKEADKFDATRRFGGRAKAKAKDNDEDC